VNVTCSGRWREYDAICVLEAEDEASVAAFTIGTALQGNVRTRTLRALGRGDGQGPAKLK
jgi:uncharacterized protein with GYD domain